MTDNYDRQMDRAIGGLEAHRDATDARLKSIEDKIDMLCEQMAVAEGGMRTLVAVGTTAAAAGAAITSALSWFINHLK